MYQKIKLFVKLQPKNFTRFSLKDYQLKLKQYIQKQLQQKQKIPGQQCIVDDLIDQTLVAPQCYQQAISLLEDNPQKTVQILQRSSQKLEIFNYLKKSVQSQGNSSPLYISGVPGIGKTVTIIQILKEFVFQYQDKVLPIYINGMNLKSPQSIYAGVLKKITRLKAQNPLMALNYLFKQPQKFFQKFKQQSNLIKIIVLDEIDQLTQNKSEVIYNFLQWAHHKNSKIILIGLSNTIDFSTRLKGRQESRMQGINIIFKVYNSIQIKKIIIAKLGSKYKTLFSNIALEFISKKIANYSSDMRLVMNLCAKCLYLTSQKYVLQQNTQIDIKIQTGIRKAPIKVSIQLVKQAIQPRIQKAIVKGLRKSLKLMLIILMSIKYQQKELQQSSIILGRFRLLMKENGFQKNIQFQDIFKILMYLKELNIINIYQKQKNQNKNSLKFSIWQIQLKISLYDYIDQEIFINYKHLYQQYIIKCEN